MRAPLPIAAGILLALALPAAAESPSTHARHPERYEAPPPLPQPAMPTVAAPLRKTGSPDVLEDESDEKRTGLPQIKQRPLAPGAKPEMVGKERLWTTRDPPGKRGVFAFLDNKIGDPLENVFPDPEEKDQFGAPLCSETAGIPGFLDCADDSIRHMVNGTWKLMFRGVEVSYLNYRYLDRKLAGFQMGFPTENFTKLADALEQIYGAPNAKERADWTVRTGYVLDVRTYTWDTPQGAMTLKSRSEALEAGMLSLFEPGAEERYNALRYNLLVSRGFNVPKPSDRAPGPESGKPAPAKAESGKADEKPPAGAPKPAAKRLQFE